MFPYRSPGNQRPARVVCHEHGLLYDPAKAGGCVVCKRNAPQALERPISWRWWGGGALLLLFANATFLLGLARVHSGEPRRDSVRVAFVEEGASRLVGNGLPLVQGVSAAPLPAHVGEEITVTCDATESNGERNHYQWVGPFGRVSPTRSATIIWTPGHAGSAALTCVAINHLGSSSRELAVEVLP